MSDERILRVTLEVLTPHEPPPVEVRAALARIVGAHVLDPGAWHPQPWTLEVDTRHGLEILKVLFAQIRDDADDARLTSESR